MRIKTKNSGKSKINKLRGRKAWQEKNMPAVKSIINQQ